MAETPPSRARRTALPLLAACLLASAAHADRGHRHDGYGNDRPRFEATFRIADRGGDERRRGRDDGRYDDRRYDNRGYDDRRQDDRRDPRQQPGQYDYWREQNGRNEFRSLAPDDQMRLRQTEQRYRQLSPQQQEQLRRRWEQMDPEQRARIRQQIEQRRARQNGR